MKPSRVPLIAGSIIVAALAAAALLAPWVAPYDPRSLVGPSLTSPSWHHLLGTNDLGQDICSQLLWGARSALVVAVAGSTIAVAVGALVGAAAALAGGVVEHLGMRLVDLFLALPGFPLVVVIAALAGPNTTLIVLLIGMAGWPSVARTIRSHARVVAQEPFVEAARSIGARRSRILARHVLPGLAPLVASRFLAFVPGAIFLEAGLAFLGIGDPIGVSWGLMLNRALSYQGLYLTEMWVWWVLPAGLAITVMVLGFALIAVGLEPRLDPQLANRA